MTNSTQAKNPSIEISTANYARVIQFIDHADRKAAYFLTIALALYASSLGVLEKATKVFIYMANDHNFVVLSIFSIVYIAFLISILYAIYKLIDVVKPRLAPKTGQKSILYFQTITQMDLNTFTKAMMDLTAEKLLVELSEQTYNVAFIANRKMELIRIGTIWLIIAGIFGSFYFIGTQIIFAYLNP